MIKKGYDALACQLMAQCMMIHTTDQKYAIEAIIKSCDHRNSQKSEKSNQYMSVYIFNIDVGLIEYKATSKSGEHARLEKITAAPTGKTQIGQDNGKEVKTFPLMVRTVDQHLKNKNKDDASVTNHAVIIMPDFVDFSFPEDWLHIKSTFYYTGLAPNQHFVILGNRRNKIPEFMERCIMHLNLADYIDYSKMYVPELTKEVTNTLKAIKCDPNSLPFLLNDRVGNFTSLEKDNIKAMIQSANVIPKEDISGFVDFATKLPSLEMANSNNVRLVMDNTMDFDQLGGLENLKADMEEASKIFIAKDSDDIKKHKVPIPKSIILQGIQGGGKTATAKAIANKFQAKAAIFNMADVFSGRLGDTEANIRSALNTLKELSPIVVLVDEIDKAMVGMESSGRSDGGTTARAIQTYLTFLSDAHDGVFLVHTANELDKLPPEFMRRGRHDNIYFVDVPTRNARSDIFKIHLKLLGTSAESIEEIMSNSDILDMTNQFTGAEIEEALKAAKRKAFIANPKTCEITTSLVIEAIKKTKAICNVDPEKINKIREWGIQNAVKASFEDGQHPSEKATSKKKSMPATSF